MRANFIIFILIVCITEAEAQDSLYVKGNILQGSEVEDGCWLFQDAKDTLVTISFSKYKELYKRARLAEIKAARLDSIVVAQNGLLVAYDRYEAKADSHIVVQKQLISVADSLYNGYKKMYTDLKTLYDVRPFCIVAGTGLYSYDNNGLKPVFNIGMEYRKFQVSGSFGKLYRGLNMQYRIPLF